MLDSLKKKTSMLDGEVRFFSNSTVREEEYYEP